MVVGKQRMELPNLLASVEEEDDRRGYSDEQFDVALLLSELGQGNQATQLAQLVEEVNKEAVCAEKAQQDSRSPSQGSGMTDRRKKQSSVESQGECTSSTRHQYTFTCEYLLAFTREGRKLGHEVHCAGASMHKWMRKVWAANCP
jgi:hypothetical protein